MEGKGSQVRENCKVSDCLTGPSNYVPRLSKEISSVFKVEKYIMFSFETGTEIQQDV